MKRWLVLMCACNQVYDLDGTRLRPDAHASDVDGDGVADAIDNCPAIANASQADEDRDTIGNACDNCPLVANADQQDIGDDDGVGDRCDPRPVGVRDCLIVFDSFDDPEAFAAHWRAASDGGNGSARALDGQVELAAPLGTMFGIHVLDDTGALLAAGTDVQLAARSTLIAGGIAGALFAGAQVTDARTGYFCGIDPTFVSVRERTGILIVSSVDLGSPPLGDEIFLRLQTVANGSKLTGCLAEFGIALGGIAVPRTMTTVGTPAALVFQGTAAVTGFTAYQQAAGATCPTPIRR